MSEFIQKHKKLTELAILVLLCILMLTAIEVRQPYFFLQDDNADSYICQYVHTIRSALEGEFPLYNFHQYAGIGFLDRGQTGQLNPVVYIGGALSYLFLGHLTGTVDFVAAIYLISGAVGMLLLLRRFKLSSASAITGAIAWSFNSFSIYCGSNWIIAIILTGCLPWIVLTSQKLIKEKSFKALVLASFAKTFLFFGGHPQYFIYAVLFDFLFAVCVILESEAKGKRLNTALKYTVRYALSGMLTALWSLPLLVPMYNAMSRSYTRSSALDFEEFIGNRFRLKDFILSQYNPLMQYDVTDTATLEDGSSIGVIDVIDAIQKNMAHVGFIVFFAAVMGIVIVVTRYKEKDSKTHEAVRNMTVCIPVLIITFLWATSSVFNRIIYLIPIFNRFRYPFKVMQYALFFLILLASVCLDYLLVNLGENKKKLAKALKVILPVAEVINLTLVYLLLPVRFFGLYTLSDKPFEDEAADLISGSRYAFVGDEPEYWDFVTYERIGHDTTATLAYNYATYFGLSNIGGYDVLLPMESCYSLYKPLCHMTNVCSNIDLYDNLVPDMSAHGVSYYVCLIENKDEVGDFLEPYGITLCYEDDVKAVFFDELAEPLVYLSCGETSHALSYEEHVNYLRITTDEVFEGGMVVANYTHDPHFIATVDGVEVNIDDIGDFSKMIIDNVPSGPHEIILRYVDNSFNYSLVASLTGTIFVVLIYASKKLLKSRKNS